MKHSSLKVRFVFMSLIFFIVIYQAFITFSYGFDKQINQDKDAAALGNMLTQNSREFSSTLSGLRIIKPEDLGLKVKRGQIDYKSMTKAQQDTIVIAMFNPEDNFLDIAVFYKSRNEIVIYLNQAYAEILSGAYILKKKLLLNTKYISEVYLLKDQIDKESSFAMKNWINANVNALIEKYEKKAILKIEN
jgi:hypothetical protein